MIRVLLSSSAAILAMLILRALFQNRISRRSQYGMTNYVLLVTLACPWCLFAPKNRWSLLSAAKPLTRAVQRNLAQPAFTAAADAAPGLSDEAAAASAAAPAWTMQTASAAPALTAGDLLLFLWIAGMVGMAVWFLIVNLRFAHFLYRNRSPLDAENRVYICEGLPSPCVFGLFRPSIYVTPEAARDERMLHHVLVHEETHIRQHDPVYALLRTLYLIVYFFNPLVWLAVRCARIDSELACDEAALKILGEDERLAYGETLLKLAPTNDPDSPLLSTTTMTGRKNRLKARLSRIAFPKKTSVLALLAAMLLFVSACVAAMSGEAGEILSGQKIDLEKLSAQVYGQEYAMHPAAQEETAPVNTLDRSLRALAAQYDDAGLALEYDAINRFLAENPDFQTLGKNYDTKIEAVVEMLREGFDLDSTREHILTHYLLYLTALRENPNVDFYETLSAYDYAEETLPAEKLYELIEWTEPMLADMTKEKDYAEMMAKYPQTFPVLPAFGILCKLYPGCLPDGSAWIVDGQNRDGQTVTLFFQADVFQLTKENDYPPCAAFRIKSSNRPGAAAFLYYFYQNRVFYAKADETTYTALLTLFYRQQVI